MGKALTEKNQVVKRNDLNSLRPRDMTLQELRFFSIYLSRINPLDVSTRRVSFPLGEFCEVMELDRIKVDRVKAATDGLLRKLVHLPAERGGYVSFQLFKECEVSRDADGGWRVSIDAHDKALPLMFEFRERFFSYPLWNVLRLRSKHHFRMYEILKQYESAGERTVGLDELKDLLGVGPEKYPRYGDFRDRVLEPSRKALDELSDISFSYEPSVRRGAGGKVLQLRFEIRRNDANISPDSRRRSLAASRAHDTIALFMGACGNEFSEAQTRVFRDMLEVRYGPMYDVLECYELLVRLYDVMNANDEKSKILNRYGYMRKLLESY
ncbi:MAG: replication initiation protein [Synergistaceae bacterium]|jgi:plasmid replication initiation protein|nr:replication initiation protein [Synergistaceae bacterium]